MSHHLDLGSWGERIAANYLREQGWFIRNIAWRSGHYDLDVVAIDLLMSTLLFVEVKTRSNECWTAPEDAVDYAKRRYIRTAAEKYLAQQHIGNIAVRFDVIAIVGTPDGPYTLRHHKGVFDADESIRH